MVSRRARSGLIEFFASSRTVERSTSNIAITLGLVARLIVAFQHVGKTRGIVQKCQVELADGAVALLGNDDLGSAFQVGIVPLVDLFAEDKHNNVSVLLD